MTDRIQSRLHMRRLRDKEWKQATCPGCGEPLPDPFAEDSNGLRKRGPKPSTCSARCRLRVWRRTPIR